MNLETGWLNGKKKWTLREGAKKNKRVRISDFCQYSSENRTAYSKSRYNYATEENRKLLPLHPVQTPTSYSKVHGNSP